MLRRLGAFAIVIAGLFLLLAMQVGAFGRYFLSYTPRTYYFDYTAGSDSNLGTSPAQAWKEVNNKLQTQVTLRPGDRVLLKCGETWANSKIGLGFSGNENAPIYFGSYGVGVKPVISATAQTYAFTAGSTRHYFVLDGINFQGGTSGCVSVAGHDISILNCDVVSSTVASGIMIFGQGIYNITVSGCRLHNNTGGSGLEIGADALPGPTNVEVTDNIAYSNGSSIAHHGIYAKRMDNYRATRNVCYSNKGAGIKLRLYSTNTRIEANHCYTNTEYGIIVDYNYTPTPNVVVANNLCVDNGVFNIVATGQTNGVEFYYNTCVNGGYRGMGINQTQVTNTVWMNNLVVQDYSYVSVGDQAFRVEAAAMLVTNTFNYNNCVLLNTGTNTAWEVGGGGGGDYTLVQWQALVAGMDANSSSVDPNFVADYTDLHLAFTSPLSVTATPLVTVTTQDYDADSRGATPAMGCFEYP
jgi:hypothetical protein